MSEEIPIPDERDPTPDDSEPAETEPSPQRTRAELDAMIERLWSQAQAQTGILDQLHERISQLEDEQEDQQPQLARWLTYPPPPAAEDPEYRGEKPLFTIAHFVQYYNDTYVGKPGTRAVPIPGCWLDHPGLLAELATLTYTWREAHIGKHATVRDAQYWHDRWRPGFAERLATEWTHPHCLTDTHKPVGAPSRTDRYTLETAATEEERRPLPPEPQALP